MTDLPNPKFFGIEALLLAARMEAEQAQEAEKSALVGDTDSVAKTPDEDADVSRRSSE